MRGQFSVYRDRVLRVMGALVTEGPFVESVEQLSGFFSVACGDFEALVKAARTLSRAHPVMEIDRSRSPDGRLANVFGEPRVRAGSPALKVSRWFS